MIVYYVLPKIYGPFPEPAKIIWITTGVLWIINYTLFASAYFFFKSSIQKQKDLLKSQEKQLTKEKESVQFENALLKAQINPHFLYNTLNFLYAKSLPISAELSEGILKLSDIMRYSVQSEDERGLVQLSSEIEHIQNIIEMNQLRFSNKLFLECEFAIIPSGAKIIPLVLLTLVENVLKHGKLNDAETPAKIILEFTGGNQLRFMTWNKKRIGPKEISTGIGLENTIKRLKNEYGCHHSLDIRNEVDSYGIELCVKLS